MSASPSSQDNLIPSVDDVGRLFALALASGMTAAIRAHLRIGKSVNSRDGVGRTPLMLAASRGHAEACEFLIEAGSNPAHTDISGMDAADWARRGGHIKVAEYLKSLERSDHPNAEPSAKTGSDTAESMHYLDDWEEYVEPEAPDNDPSAIAEIASVQRILSLHDGEFDDENWRDVVISLPSFISERVASSHFSEEVQDYLSKCLVEGARIGLIDITEVDRFMPPLQEIDPQELLVHLGRVAGDAGIQVVGIKSPYRNHLGPEYNAKGRADERSEAAEIVLEIDHLLDSRHDPLTAAEHQISQVRRLGRFEELTLFRTIRKAADDELIAIAQSTPGFALLQSYCRRVETGELSFAQISELELDDDLSEIADQPNDEAVEERINLDAIEFLQTDGIVEVSSGIEVTAPQLPSTITAALSRVISFDVSLAPPADTRAAIDAIKALALSDAFFELFLSDLKGEEAGQCASVIVSCRSAVRKARDKIIVAHLPHVMRLAKRFEGRGMPVLDLFQEGSIGLFRAIELFEPERGFRFQTYAMNWVRQQVSRAIADKARLIRIPVHRLETLTKIYRFQIEFAGLNNRDPTSNEIAEGLDYPVRAISKLLVVAESPATLDGFVDDDDRLMDGIADANGYSALDRQIQSGLKCVVTKVLTTLSAREERILRMRFGIGMRTDHTLEEVGNQFGVTRERIRQIEADALRKLKHPSRARALRNFLDQ